MFTVFHSTKVKRPTTMLCLGKGKTITKPNNLFWNKLECFILPYMSLRPEIIKTEPKPQFT